MTLDQVAQALNCDKERNGNLIGPCPVCQPDGCGRGDGHIAVAEARNGGVLVNCIRDCDKSAILEAVGLTLKDLAPAKRESRIVETYDYTDDGGRLLFQVVRFDPKDFRQRKPKPTGGWDWSVKGADIVPYRLPALREAIQAGRTVYLVEGEKDADRGAAAGLVCTTFPMGAGKWRKGYDGWFQGANIIIVPDRDADEKGGKPHRAGQLHAADICDGLRAVIADGASVAVLELPDRGGSPVNDLADWLEAGGTGDELHSLAKQRGVDPRVYSRTQREWLEGAQGRAMMQQPQQGGLAGGVDALDDEATDLAAAHRLVARHGRDIRYCGEREAWLVWDGRRWAPDIDHRIEYLAGEAARAWTVSKLGSDARSLAAAKRMESRQRMTGAIMQSRSLPSVVIRSSHLDQQGDYLTCLNGSVDLRTGELTPHAREHLCTHLVDVEYAPDATAPRFEAFLEEIHPGKSDITDFLRRWLGYSLTGHVNEQALVLAVGAGRNGKGTLFEAFGRILGEGLSGQAPPGLLMAHKGERHPADMMALRGKRYVYASEVERRAAFSEERMKFLTGGDTISARGMRENYQTFRPTHKLVLYVNQLPQVRDNSHAFWRRMRVVPFDERFDGDRLDKLLGAKLDAEAQGLLAWAVRGAVDWYASGLPIPVDVAAASQAYRSDSDDIGRFLVDHASDPSNRGEVLLSRFCGDYNQWADGNGGRECTTKAFAQELKDRKCASRRTKKGMMYEIPTLRELSGEGVGCRVVQGFPCQPLMRAHKAPNTDLHAPPYTSDLSDGNDTGNMGVGSYTRGEAGEVEGFDDYEDRRHP